MQDPLLISCSIRWSGQTFSSFVVPVGFTVVGRFVVGGLVDPCVVDPRVGLVPPVVLPLVVGGVVPFVVGGRVVWPVVGGPVVSVVGGRVPSVVWRVDRVGLVPLVGRVVLPPVVGGVVPFVVPCVVPCVVGGWVGPVVGVVGRVPSVVCRVLLVGLVPRVGLVPPVVVWRVGFGPSVVGLTVVPLPSVQEQ